MPEQQHGVPYAVSCRALGVSQSWLYKWLGGRRSPRCGRRERLKAEIARLFAGRGGRDGSPRITAALRDGGWTVSENTVAGQQSLLTGSVTQFALSHFRGAVHAGVTEFAASFGVRCGQNSELCRCHRIREFAPNSPRIRRRIAELRVIEAGTLDSLPHNAAVVTLLAVCNSTHRESYMDIVMVSIVGGLLALAVVIVLGSAVGVVLSLSLAIYRTNV